MRAGIERALHQRHARCLADVVGARLERHAPEGQREALQSTGEFREQLLPEVRALILVHLVHRGVQLAVEAHGLAHAHHGQRVLREAAAAVAQAGVQELVADAAIRAHAAAHAVHVCAVFLAQIGHLVDEADLAGQHGVARVLHHLGAAHIHDQDRVALAHERLVQLAHHVAGFLALHAAHHAVGLVEVGDGIAFLQELRVVGDVEGHLGAALDQVAHLVAGAHGHRALHHHGLGLAAGADALQFIRDVLRHGQHVLQVGAAVLVARRAHADEDGLGVAIGLGLVHGEADAVGGDVLLQHLAQAGLVDGAFALAQQLDLARVHVQTHHLVAHGGKAGARDQPHVSGSDHGEFHLRVSPVERRDS